MKYSGITAYHKLCSFYKRCGLLQSIFTGSVNCKLFNTFIKRVTKNPFKLSSRNQNNKVFKFFLQSIPKLNIILNIPFPRLAVFTAPGMEADYSLVLKIIFLPEFIPEFPVGFIKEKFKLQFIRIIYSRSRHNT